MPFCAADCEASGDILGWPSLHLPLGPSRPRSARHHKFQQLRVIQQTSGNLRAPYGIPPHSPQGFRRHPVLLGYLHLSDRPCGGAPMVCKQS